MYDILDKASTVLSRGDSVLFILHGLGERGVLRGKIWSSLKRERIVESFEAADKEDGGGAFTKVKLKRP